MQKWMMVSLVILLLSLLSAQTIFAAEEFVYQLSHEDTKLSIDVSPAFAKKTDQERPICRYSRNVLSSEESVSQGDGIPVLQPGWRASLAMSSLMTWSVPERVPPSKQFIVPVRGKGMVRMLGTVDGGSTHSAIVSVSNNLQVAPSGKYFFILGETLPVYQTNPLRYKNTITMKPAEGIDYAVTAPTDGERFEVFLQINGPCTGSFVYVYKKQTSEKKDANSCKYPLVLDEKTRQCECKDSTAQKTIKCETSCVTDADCPDPPPEETGAPRGHKCALVQGRKTCVWDQGGNRFTFDGGCPGNKGTSEKPEPVCHPTVHTCVETKVQRGAQTETRGMCILTCPTKKEVCVSCTKEEAGTKVASSFEDLKALPSEETSLRNNAITFGSSVLGHYNYAYKVKR